MRPFGLAAALALTLGAAAAQDDERMRLAQEYADLPSVRAIQAEMLSVEAVMAQLVPLMPPEAGATPEMMRRVSEIVAEELALVAPALAAASRDGAAKLFTAEELEALIAFHRSPEGAAVMGKMQPYMAAVIDAVGPQMQASMRNLRARLEAEFGGQ